MEIKMLSEHLAVIGRTYILDAIQECRGDRSEAAKRLGISMATLYRKLGPAASPLDMPNARTLAWNEAGRGNFASEVRR